ncbi:MAG: hypothetical protein AAFR90_14425 [Pseudomonadota bacterium]
MADILICGLNLYAVALNARQPPFTKGKGIVARNFFDQFIADHLD